MITSKGYNWMTIGFGRVLSFFTFEMINFYALCYKWLYDLTISSWTKQNDILSEDGQWHFSQMGHPMLPARQK